MARSGISVVACGWLLLAVWLGACGESGGPRIRKGDRVQVAVVIPQDAGTGLTEAAGDLALALGLISGAAGPAEVHRGDPAGAGDDLVVVATVDPGRSDGDQCYRIRSGAIEEAPGKKGLAITAVSETGAAYGLYRVAVDLGVIYLHPEETFYPRDRDARLPWGYDDKTDCPGFSLRGFHHHTQHPVVMSDFLLRTDRSDFYDYALRYLRWLARNRQNALSFHMLKTVDVDAWLPWIARIVEAAHARGIRVGPVLSFSDQQQNNFKLIDEDSEVSEDVQIKDGLDTLLPAGFDFVTFQIGSSEFTKPGDQQTVDRLDAATAHLRERGVASRAWIHNVCTVHDDEGGLFYHLPLRATTDLGAFVHTTMFYTLEHPAPVYGCEDFSHQEDFMRQADGAREQVFFPETAWWLGFDNNLPLGLPITGWSRAHDIQEVLPRHRVGSHVTFTTGLEWNYWQYDHFLTRATWDPAFGWDAYLDWIRPLYGKHGKKAARTLKNWTGLQRAHFYEENPLIIFYLAGELPQDEIGAQAGILARRPKLAFRDLVRFDDKEFREWSTRDFEMLQSMAEQVRKLASGLPARLDASDRLQVKLFRELRSTLDVYLARIEHTVALYAGAAAVRDTDEPEAVRMLEQARAVSAGVLPLFEAMESDYRYPVELLARDKPESLTSYPYGYLAQTSTGYFWTRREEQLDALIARTFHPADESWNTRPDHLFFTDRDRIELTRPESELAKDTLPGFLPRMLFGLVDHDEEAGSSTLVLAQDHNETSLPDPGTEQSLELTRTDDGWIGTDQALALVVYDAAGQDMGQLVLADPAVHLAVDPGPVLTAGELEGQVASGALVGLVVQMGGIDEEGVKSLLKAVYQIPAGEDLPPMLPFAFTMTFDPVGG